MSLSVMIGLLLLTIVGSLFFSGTETGVLTADTLELKSRARKGSKAAEKLLEILGEKEFLLGTILVGNNLMNVSCSALATSLMTSFSRDWGPELGTLIVTPVLLLVGEILPKTVYLSRGTPLLIHTQWLLRLCMIVFKPLTHFTVYIPKRMTRKRKQSNGAAGPSRRDLQIWIHTGAFQNSEVSEELKMVSRLMDFHSRKVRSVMVPLVDVATVPRTAKVELAYRLIRARGVSRLPVFEDRPDNIVGVIHVRDLLQFEDLNQPLEQVIQPARFVPEQQHITELLPSLWGEDELAIVVDEYGVAIGIVTNEDLVEEIVGDIRDEFDEPDPLESMSLTRGSFIVSGTMSVHDFNEKIHDILPRGEDETVAGVINTFLQRIPERGEVIRMEGMEVTILEATPRRVFKILVRLIQ